MIKQIQLFLSTEDEVAFSDAIREVRPRMVVVDGSRWTTLAPPVAESIAACASAFAFLWDQGIVGRLPIGPSGDAGYEGPRTGVVIELTRSRPQENLLLSGRLAASPVVHDKQVAAAMDQFANDVWKVMKSVTHSVVAVDPASGKIVRNRVTEYRAGLRACAWALSAPEHYFRDRSVQVYFKPKMVSTRASTR